MKERVLQVIRKSGWSGICASAIGDVLGISIGDVFINISDLEKEGAVKENTFVYGNDAYVSYYCDK